MKDRIEKAKKAVQDVIQEFEPARDHAVGAGREILMAMRSVIDAELRLFDKATAPKAGQPGRAEPEAPTTTIPVEDAEAGQAEGPPAGPDHPA